MKYRIIKEINYNKFGNITNTVFTVKNQKSFLGIKYWKYVSNWVSGMGGGYTINWEDASLEVIEDLLDTRIEEIKEEEKNTITSVKTEIVKEITS